MLGLSWAELAVIGVVIILFIRPEDVPGILRGLGRLVQKMKAIAAEFSSIMDDVAKEPPHTITNDEGEAFGAYDVEDLEALDVSRKHTKH